jgi:cytochrome c peroxidase
MCGHRAPPFGHDPLTHLTIPSDRALPHATADQRTDGERRRADQEFPLRGIKDSPAYLHDGRLLTLEDTVEFFNLVPGTQLSAQEKQDLVAFLERNVEANGDSHEH